MKLYNPSDPEGKDFIEVERTDEELRESLIRKYREKAEEIQEDMKKPESDN